MKTLTKRQATTYTIFFILLATRISLSLIALIYINFLSTETIPSWVDWLGKVAPWLNAFYMTGAFPLIVVVLMLNRDDLPSLNIDKFFIFIFLYSGFATLQEYLGFGWPVNVATVFVIYLLLKNKLKFSNANPSVLRISLFVGGVFLVCLLAVSNFLDVPKIERTIYLFFFETIPSTVYEEVIYRGILWMFLRNLSWSDRKIFLLQAFLFWISHIDYVLRNPFNFWIFVPVVSLLLGYVVLRSKSITPSTIVHMLINLFYGLILVSL